MHTPKQAQPAASSPRTPGGLRGPGRPAYPLRNREVSPKQISESQQVSTDRWGRAKARGHRDSGVRGVPGSFLAGQGQLTMEPHSLGPHKGPNCKGQRARWKPLELVRSPREFLNSYTGSFIISKAQHSTSELVLVQQYYCHSLWRGGQGSFALCYCCSLCTCASRASQSVVPGSAAPLTAWKLDGNAGSQAQSQTCRLRNSGEGAQPHAF